jgi:hypothetical protein
MFAKLQIDIQRSLADVSATEWDALLAEDSTPFVRWAWLEAFEHSGCVGEGTSWTPCHLTVREGGSLVAAAPCYLKDGSDGDFSRDWGWADAAMRAGLPFYPKLVVGVPFTPCTGQRFLTARQDLIAVLARALPEVARELGAHVIQVLFPSEAESRLLEDLGLHRRVSFQYHWRNQNYSNADAFLACFSSKKRNQAKRERRAPAEQGITLRTVRGAEIADAPVAWARQAHDLHRSTVDKLMWGRRWLNRAFYERVFTNMPDAVEVVAAERQGKLIAGAFNVSSRTHLYGRYWGCFEEHRFLHFNVCLHHSIDDCIARGLQVFEGGAGGEHKIARGFEPAETWSNHAFLDKRLAMPIRQYLQQEAEERRRALERWYAETPVLKRP